MASETNLTVAEAPCDRCSKKTEVKLNKAGRAYYVCGWCGWRGEQGNKVNSHKWVSTLTGEPVAPPPLEPSKTAPVAPKEGGTPLDATPIKKTPARASATLLG